MKRLINLLAGLVLLCAPLDAKTHVEIAEENSPAIVAINVLQPDTSTSTGTGFVVSSDGLIATSRHVVDQAFYVNVTFNTGVISGPAKTIFQSDQVDLALIKIDARNLPTVTFADSDYVLPGQPITVIGNPRRLQNTISSGLISQVRKKSDGVIWHQISAPISPSSSGSPVFNQDGHVVSMAFSSYKGEGNQNLNFAVPSNYIIELIRLTGREPALTQDPNVPQNTSLWEKFKAHLSKSWEMTKQLFSRHR